MQLLYAIRPKSSVYRHRRPFFKTQHIWMPSMYAGVVCMCVFCWPVPNMRPNWVDTSIFGGISRSIWNLAAPMYPSPISVVLHQSDLGRGDLAAICSYEMANADRNATSSKNRKMNITIKAVANNDAERTREKWRRISKNIRSQKTPTGIW